MVQLYLGTPAESGEPPKQLKGFEKIHLEPDESRIVTLELDGSHLAAWDMESHNWRVWPGRYSIMIGGSSRDIRLEDSFLIR